MAVNDTMLLISGRMALTQQSTIIVERFLSVDDGDRPMWQPTPSDLVVIFISQNQLILLETAVGDMKGQTTINRKVIYHG